VIAPRRAGYDAFDLLASMVAVVEPGAGRCAFVNAAFEQVFGLSRRSVARASIYDWFVDPALMRETVLAVSSNQVATSRFDALLKALPPLHAEPLPVHVIVNQIDPGGAVLVEMLEVESRDLIEYTQVIIHEADRLQTLVDRLLAPHRRPHVVGDVNIHEVCERVRSVILAEFPRDLHIERDFDVSIPEFRGDREQLIQATLNIVHNAAQALAERRAAGDAQITFKTRIARQVIFNKQWYRLALELHVIDNGPGVPDAIKDRIFYQLVSGRDGGTGLGLTLAQTFVQQHHGVIECDSVPGRTDFKILIPLP